MTEGSRSELVPGRYFITVVAPGLVVQGTWVLVTSREGAAFLLGVCTDCPVPLGGCGGG